jgi:hypothetical protein
MWVLVVVVVMCRARVGCQKGIKIILHIRIKEGVLHWSEIILPPAGQSLFASHKNP